jgi:hypothetical protein
MIALKAGVTPTSAASGETQVIEGRGAYDDLEIQQDHPTGAPSDVAARLVTAI